MNVRYIVAGIIQDGDKVVLGKKAHGRPPYPDVWHTPGGGADDTEKAQQLFESGDFENEYFHRELAREMKEELGLQIANIHNIVPQYRSAPRESETENKHGELTHYYFLEYLSDYKEGALKPADDLVEAIWVPKSELKKYQLTPPSQEMYKELGWV